jgi:hypothetical protein
MLRFHGMPLHRGPVWGLSQCLVETGGRPAAKGWLHPIPEQVIQAWELNEVMTRWIFPAEQEGWFSHRLVLVEPPNPE